jgi:hypothetical protein
MTTRVVSHRPLIFFLLLLLLVDIRTLLSEPRHHRVNAKVSGTSKSIQLSKFAGYESLSLIDSIDRPPQILIFQSVNLLRIVRLSHAADEAGSLTFLDMSQPSSRRPHLNDISIREHKVPLARSSHSFSVADLIEIFTSNSVPDPGKWSYIGSGHTLFGIYYLPQGFHIAVGTSVGAGIGKDFFIPNLHTIDKFQFFQLPTWNTTTSSRFDVSTRSDFENAKAVKILMKTLSRHSFYFCGADHDITRSLQSVYLNGERSTSVSHSWKQCDRTFFWNINALGALIRANCTECWIVPCVNAVIASRVSCVSIDGDRRACSKVAPGHSAPRISVPVKLLLIARRGWQQQGQRYLRRGCSSAGHVANLVETEQLVLLSDRSVRSFVQVFC